MSEIIIGGVNINDIEKQIKGIQQEANKFVSENIETVTALVDQLLTSEDKEEIEAKATLASSLLKDVYRVSRVCGVQFVIPWDNEYDTTYYSKLEDFEYGCDDEELKRFLQSLPVLDVLMSTFSNMEYDAKKWYQSTC